MVQKLSDGARRSSLWVEGAVLLAAVIAFIWAPKALLTSSFPRYTDSGQRRDALAHALVQYWRGAATTPSTALADLVHFWMWWHAIKILICVIMVAACAFLTRGLWRQHSPAHRARGALATAATIVTTTGGLIAAGLLAVNVQATAVPLMALMPELPKVGARADLDKVRDEISEALAAKSNTISPPLQHLLDSARMYSVVLTVMCVVSVGVCTLVALRTWRHRRLQKGSSESTVTATVISCGAAIGIGLFLALGIIEIAAAATASSTLLGIIGATA